MARRQSTTLPRGSRLPAVLRAELQASVSRPAMKPVGEAMNRQVAFYAAALAASREA